MVKQAAYGLLAAFLASGVYGDIPTTAEGWYTPSGGFAAQSGTGTIYYGYDRATGEWQSTTVTVDTEGNITGGMEDFGRDYDLLTAYQALAKALYNEAYNAVQDEAIQTIGKNLHALTSKDGIHIRNENTGQEFTIKFGGSIATAVSESSGDIPATSDENLADNMSLDWTNNGRLELNGWANDSPVLGTLGDELTKENGAFRDYSVVMRPSEGGRLEYMKIGSLLAGVRPDGDSVTTNSADGAVADGTLSMFGFDTAIAGLEDASDGALVPYVDSASTKLQWGGMEQFFSDSVFRKSETTGKILLNGTSEDGKVKVLTMTGTGGDDQNVSALTFDGSSVDGIVGGYVQLHGFDTAVSPYTSGDVSFADVLTNTATQITGMSILVRTPEEGATTGHVVKYVPLGKITGIPAAPVDNITIELNETDPLNTYLQLHGAAGEGVTLETGDVYMIGDDGKGKFGKQNAADGDDSELLTGENSLESYTNSEGEKFFRIKGWDENREGTAHLLGWEANVMHYFEVEGNGGIEAKTTSAGDTVQLAGHDTAANGAIPYKVDDGNGLGWLTGVDDRVPLLHTSGVPTTMAIGGSLDKANVSAVPTLNVSGFTAGGNCTAKLNTMLSDPNDGSNRSAHQFMARYSSGGGTPTVHWVSIDDVIGGGGSPVDDTSITTNTSHGASSDGVASIFGFSAASAGDIPHKTDDGKIEWKPVANGGALIVSGTSGSTVTTATCTNKLSFVSASDSNVKFTVTNEGDGNVKVTVGVYYK